MKNKVKIKSIYYRFRNYPQKEVEIALTKLDDEEIGYIFRLHLGNLRSNATINSENLERYEHIISKIRKIIIKRKSKNIFELLPDYSKREIWDAFYRLSKENQELLKSVYGKNLNDQSPVSSEMCIRAYGIMKKALKRKPSKKEVKPREVKNLFEKLSDYSKKQVLEAFNELSIDRKQILKKAYGENLEDRLLYSKLTANEKTRVNNIVYKYLTKTLRRKTNRTSSGEIIYINNKEYYEKETTETIKEEQLLETNRDETTDNKDKQVETKNNNIDEDLIYIKRIKFVFFKNANEEKRKEYIESLFAVSPELKNKYLSSTTTEKEQIMIEIIEEAKKWATIFLDKKEQFIKDIAQKYPSIPEQKAIEIGKKALLESIELYELKMENFSEFSSEYIAEKYRNYIIKLNKENLEEKAKKRQEQQTVVTNSSVYDMMKKLTYKKLSRKDEIVFIKKAKLSYYHDVSEKERKEYLNYYMEVFPNFKRKYLPASSKEKETLLKEAIEDSKHWRHKFLENNQRLIINTIKIYGFSGTYEDLVMEGNFGLMRALEKIDPNKGIKFSTYATWWIRQTIDRYVKTGTRTVRLPVYLELKFNTLKKARQEYEFKYHKMPSPEELAEITNLSLSIVKELIQYEVQFSTQQSLNTIIIDDSNEELESIVEDKTFSYDKIDEELYYEKIKECLYKSNLDKRTLEIIKLRYGLEDGIPRTLEYVGQIYGITRERVRQIELKGLKSLKNNTELRNLCSDEQKEELSKKSNLEKSDKIVYLQRLKKIIQKLELSSTEIMIINMFYVDKLSIKQISEKIGISLSEVDNIKTKILERANKQGINI